MPIISIDATFFWQIINFFVLLFIVKIEAELVEATKNREEAEKLHKEAEAQVLNSRKEASEIVKNAQRKAEEEAHLLIKEARENREKNLPFLHI